MKKIAIFHHENLNAKKLSSVGIYIKNIINFSKENNYSEISFKYLYFGKKEKKFLFPISLQLLIGLIRKNKQLNDFDTIWVHNIFFTLLLLFFPRLSLVLTIHGRQGSNVFAYNSNIKIWAIKQIEKKLICKCEKIILVNKEDCKYYQRLFPRHKNKFCFIPTFCNENNFYPLDRIKCRKKLKLDLNKKIFIYTGRLVYNKQIDKSLQIFQQFNNIYPESLFLIIGNGDQKSFLKKMARKLNITSNVLFIPEMANEKLLYHYNASDVYLTCSMSEGMSISMLEAMACGKPVLAHASDSINFLIKNKINGLKFNLSSSSIYEIIKKIDEIINLPSISQTTIQSVKKYQTNKVIPRLISLLQNE